ncbi:Zinc finger protein 208 [Anopheles sinensis]|uniref:Zinc finger protein 208 n=1 Tax=Anopheles sinensis TaxID=74873 RepID=A0A084WHA4_ANOSI|nr:Zinc finger protein 208 [Anopheles sinensis]
MALTALCRTCAGEQSMDQLVDIFEVYDQDETIAEMIVELTGLTVEDDTNLPTVCCTQCQVDLIAAVAFRRKCIESEKLILDHLREQNCTQILQLDAVDDAQSEKSLEDDLEQETVQISSIESYIALIEDIQICRGEEQSHGPSCETEQDPQGGGGDEEEEEQHIQEEEEAEVQDTNLLNFNENKVANDTDKSFNTTILSDQSQLSHKCCGCSASFETEQDLMEHSQSTHALNPPTPDPTRPFQCNICYCCRRTERGLEQHRKVLQNLWLKKTSIGAQAQAEANANNSANTAETVEVEAVNTCFYECSVCNESFLDVSSLHDHNATFHGKETANADMNDSYNNVEMIDNGSTDEACEMTLQEPDDLKYSCCGCTMCFGTEKELMEHSETTHAPNAPPPHKSKPVQCNVCYSWYSSERSCRDHQVYMGNRQFVCPVCGMRFGRASALLRHKHTHDRAPDLMEVGPDVEPDVQDKPQHSCCGCFLSFETEDELMKHSVSVHAPNAPPEDDNKPVQCNICYCWYSSERACRDHQVYMTNRRFGCTVCGLRFGRASALARHRNTHEEALIFSCKYCAKLFSSTHQRLNHEKREHENQLANGSDTESTGEDRLLRIRNTHEKLLLFSCKYCEKQFPNAYSRMSHEKREHEKPPVTETEAETAGEDPTKRTCCGCSKTFASEQELMDHARTVHAPNAPPADPAKPARCKLCYRTYRSEAAVRVHQRCMRMRSLQCATCGKSFATRSHLSAHENVHTKALIYACAHCDEKFANKTAKQKHILREHASVETRAKSATKHVCLTCGKAFYSIFYLRDHLKLHADDMPHKCHCGAKFKLEKYLKRHMQIHSGKYTCQYCTLAYRCASMLRDHENRHTGNKEFPCDMCSKRFYGKADVAKHRAYVHFKRGKLAKASS